MQFRYGSDKIKLSCLVLHGELESIQIPTFASRAKINLFFEVLLNWIVQRDGEEDQTHSHIFINTKYTLSAHFRWLCLLYVWKLSFSRSIFLWHIIWIMLQSFETWIFLLRFVNRDSFCDQISKIKEYYPWDAGNISSSSVYEGKNEKLHAHNTTFIFCIANTEMLHLLSNTL